MCTTVRYYFSCEHPATHRYRTDVCETSQLGACRIKDTNKRLRIPCGRCLIRQGIKFQIPAELQLKESEDIWHVPTRCFVDVGFRTLDPFREDQSPPTSPLSLAPTILSPTSNKRHSVWPHSPNDDSGKCAKLLARVMRFKKVNPCCEERARRGAFPAVRLEELESRNGGRMMDDHCQAMV